MRLVARILAVLLVVPATFYFVLWVPFSILPLGSNRLIAFGMSMFCTIGVGWFVWRTLKSDHAGVIVTMLLGAVLLGAVGFNAGFFGPLILTDANQGPLLGLFITGPLGFMVGAIAGAVYWVKRDEDERVCYSCGYNLCATTEERCPECGSPIGGDSHAA